MPSLVQKSKSVSGQKLAAYLHLAQDSETFWAAIIVFLGALFLISTFPFYPIYLTVLLALICGFIASKDPKFGTLLSMIFAFPAVAYQSPLLTWVFVLAIALTLFEMFQNWVLVSLLQIFVLAPFAFGASPILGWISILGVVFCSMHFGSKKSIFISLPAIYMILFLSAAWLIPNGLFLPIKSTLYSPAFSGFLINKGEVGLLEIPSEITRSFSNVFSLQILLTVNQALSQTIDNTVKLLFSDSAVIQLLGWGFVIYLIGYLSGEIKGKRKETLSSLTLILLIPVYYFVSKIYLVDFNPGLIVAIALAIVVVGLSEQFGLQLSREAQIRRSDKTKQFGKFGISDVATSDSEKSLDDVGGYEDVKQELKDSILLPLEKKEVSYAYNIKPPSGILLFGPPGTGKTMLMRALSKELRYGFYYVKSSDILSQWFGESERNVAELFSIARKQAPCILFFDEIDALGKKRTGYSTDEVTPRVLTTLLQEMDGIKNSKKPILVMGATNIPRQLDPAILRPGRFDKIIYMHLPDLDARLAILKVHTNKVPLSDDLDFNLLAKKTERFSGADLKNLCDEAIKIAAKEASKSDKIVPITMNHFLSVLSYTKPSTGLATIDEYEQFKLDFERSSSGETKAKEDVDTVKWADVAGLSQVKKALLETIELPLLYEKEMKELKIKPSKGVLLFGPPGTGKTLIVRAASNELKASFQVLSPAELMKQGYTQAVNVLKEIFNRAKENTPAIIFVDEIETFAPARGIGSNEVLGQFLTELDGVKELRGVVVIAATNRPAALDPAVLRPGRFDKIFYISPPNQKDREDIFRIHLGEFAEHVDLSSLASATPGFSGADIASICQEMKMEALRFKISKKTFEVDTKYLLKLIKSRRPSITKPMLEEYENFLEVYGERSGISEDSDNNSNKDSKDIDTHYR